MPNAETVNPTCFSGEAETGRSKGELWPAETSSATTSLRRMLVRLPSPQVSLLSCIIDAEGRTGRRGNRYPERVIQTRIEDEGYDFHQIRGV
jgi:hypothetical protein